MNDKRAIIANVRQLGEVADDLRLNTQTQN